jgi:cold shock CspA family protein
VIYFHRNSVLKNAFDRLEIGSEVRFSEEAGEQGPQASSVTLVGKHHVVG